MGQCGGLFQYHICTFTKIVLEIEYWWEFEESGGTGGKFLLYLSSIFLYFPLLSSFNGFHKYFPVILKESHVNVYSSSYA